MELVADFRPDVLISARFTNDLAQRVSSEAKVRWCFINATYYLGKDSPRDLKDDYAPGVAEVAATYFVPLAEQADMVLHATDPVLDFPPEPLRPRHRNIGLMMLEPPGDRPDYMDESGDPWALVSLSVVAQDGLAHTG